MRLVVEGLSASADFTEFVDAMFETFYNTNSTRDYAIVLWGEDGPESRQRAKDRMIHELGTEKNQVIRVVRDLDAGGKIVSGSEWHVNVNNTPGLVAPWELDITWLEGEDKEAAQKFISILPEHVNNALKREGGSPLGEPHIRLMIMWTLPEYQRKGAGAAQVAFGCGLADYLNIATWVEASVDGKPLYESKGFKELETNSVSFGRFSSQQVVMRRPPKSKENVVVIPPR